MLARLFENYLKKQSSLLLNRLVVDVSEQKGYCVTRINFLKQGLPKMIECKQLYSCYYRLFQCSKIMDHIVLSLASLCNYLSKEIHTPPQPWEHLSRMIEVITCHIYQTLRQSLSQQCSQSPLNTQNRVFIQFSGGQRSKVTFNTE